MFPRLCLASGASSLERLRTSSLLLAVSCASLGLGQEAGDAVTASAGALAATGSTGGVPVIAEDGVCQSGDAGEGENSLFTAAGSGAGGCGGCSEAAAAPCVAVK